MVHATHPELHPVIYLIYLMTEKRLDTSEASVQSVHPGIEGKSDTLTATELLIAPPGG